VSADDVVRRLCKLEQSQETLEDSLYKLNTTIALLNHTVEAMSKREEKRQQFQDRTVLFFLGSLIAAASAWVFRGGLGQ
jgi:prefoldin subunit 5